MTPQELWIQLSMGHVKTFGDFNVVWKKSYRHWHCMIAQTQGEKFYD